jgi:protein subunit release factor A
VPTGLVETCAVYPTQIANRAEALRVLTARVRALEARRRP